ncbi:MAG: protein-L-isoaspartate(D-aspartate) O-methyltransferase [Chloroflexota bacterium]|nr:protein-L-isoaspartate(D-aspartate) O-methyltransferase [Chloroflexota bacterium]
MRAATEHRARMVAEQIECRGVRQQDVLRAMREVPRERFVAIDLRDRAFWDGALSIAGGQTISQPYMVARMTEALDLPGYRAREGHAPLVLDVGTGSGYQAAVLAATGAMVVSIERDPGLADEARLRLAALGYAVEVVLGDGSEGYAPRAPYAGIIVAAAAPAAPPPLIDQLAPHSRLVIPIGPRGQQWLTVLERTPTGLATRSIEPCVFVPLVGRHGFAEA